MKLSELLSGAGLDAPIEDDIAVTGLTADSRTVSPGMLFAAMPGTAIDGAEFVPAAIAAGASAVLVAASAEADTGSVPYIAVDDPRQALARLAAKFYPEQPSVMAAVTGTAGKTSVASFLRQIWAQCGEQAAMVGTTGIVTPKGSEYGSLTTPDPIRLHEILQRLARDGVTHCAMEASSHGLDQHRLDGVRLAVAGFTNLGRDHLDYHPTIENYLQAKLKLFENLLPPGGPAVIYSDDAFSQQVVDCVSKAGRHALTVGRQGDFIAVKRVEQKRFDQHADIEHDGVAHRITLPLAGEFQLANALVAAGMAIASGSEAVAVFKALEQLEGAPGRLDLVGKTSDGAPVYVDYAHKPEALENVLTALRPYTTGKLVLVFGCGGDRDAGKRPIMGEIAARLADRVYVTDDNPRTEDAASIRSAIMATATQAVEIADRRDAIERATAELGIGDCLVVAGKGHEEGQIVGDAVLPFSDHQVVTEALEKRS